MNRIVCLTSVLLLVVSSLRADVKYAPPYVPQASVSGTLHLSGNPAMTAVVQQWVKGFKRVQPKVDVVLHLTGTDTGIAALYTGKAELALMGREPYPIEIQAFEWVFRYKPTQLRIMTGSLDHVGQSPALVVIVNRRNPLTRLTTAQLESLFGAEPRSGPPRIRTWGDLGLSGEWKDKAIQLYSPDATSGTGRFFRHIVLGDSRMMNWDHLTEFSISASAVDAASQVASAVGADPYGLGVSTLEFLSGSVAQVALSPSAGLPPVLANNVTVFSGEYPLSRPVVACINRKPGEAANPIVREFLTYILSEEGQSDILESGGYLPLNPDTAKVELGKL